MQVKQKSLHSRLNDLETVTVSSTIVKKSDHCKYLGVT